MTRNERRRARRRGKRSGVVGLGTWLGLVAGLATTALTLSWIPPDRRLRGAVFCLAAGLVAFGVIAIPVEVVLDRRRRGAPGAPRRAATVTRRSKTKGESGR